MNMFEAYLPDDIYSMIVTGMIGLIVIWLVMFVVRKLMGVALAVALIFGGWWIWHDPTLLNTAQDTAVGYYDQWRNGASSDYQRPRW